MSQWLSGKNLALISPAERLCHSAIKILDKGQHFSLEIGDRSEDAAFEQLTSENGEPKLNLVHPGSVLGSVVKDDAMGGVTEEGRAGVHRSQDAGLSFDPQVEVQVGLLGDKPNKRFGLMGVEMVDNEMPLHDVGMSVNSALNMSQKVFLIPGRASRNLTDRALGDMEVDDEGQCAMPDVLELPTQHPSRLHRQVGVLGFERLHAGHFIGAHNRFSPFRSCLGGLVQFIDVGDFFVRLRVGFRIQPVADQVRLKRPL
jgi:hypothetical protein